MKNYLQKLRAATPLEVLPLLAVIDVLTGRIQQLREEDARRDRGDISITTVIVWVAVISVAVLITGGIVVIGNKYYNKIKVQ